MSTDCRDLPKSFTKYTVFPVNNNIQFMSVGYSFTSQQSLSRQKRLWSFQFQTVPDTKDSFIDLTWNYGCFITNNIPIENIVFEGNFLGNLICNSKCVGVSNGNYLKYKIIKNNSERKLTIRLMISLISSLCMIGKSLYFNVSLLDSSIANTNGIIDLPVGTVLPTFMSKDDIQTNLNRYGWVLCGQSTIPDPTVWNCAPNPSQAYTYFSNTIDNNNPNIIPDFSFRTPYIIDPYNNASQIGLSSNLVVTTESDLNSIYTTTITTDNYPTHTHGYTANVPYTDGQCSGGSSTRPNNVGSEQLSVGGILQCNGTPYDNPPNSQTFNYSLPYILVNYIIKIFDYSGNYVQPCGSAPCPPNCYCPVAPSCFIQGTTEKLNNEFGFLYYTLNNKYSSSIFNASSPLNPYANYFTLLDSNSTDNVFSTTIFNTQLASYQKNYQQCNFSNPSLNVSLTVNNIPSHYHYWTRTLTNQDNKCALNVIQSIYHSKTEPFQTTTNQDQPTNIEIKAGNYINSALMYLKQENSVQINLPVGSIIFFSLSECGPDPEPVKGNMLLCNGQAFNENEYPLLFQVLNNTANVPNFSSNGFLPIGLNNYQPQAGFKGTPGNIINPNNNSLQIINEQKLGMIYHNHNFTQYFTTGSTNYDLIGGAGNSIKYFTYEGGVPTDCAGGGSSGTGDPFSLMPNITCAAFYIFAG